MEDSARHTPIIPPADIAGVVKDGMIAKANKGRFEMFLLALSAGALIGVGFIFFTTTQMGASAVEWYGLTKLIGGLAFTVGLFLVIVTGADLFTSTTMTVIPLIDRQITVRQWLVHWGIVYAGNVIGAVLLATLVFFAGTYMQGDGAWGAVAVNTATAKISHGWAEAFLLGVLANFLVCLGIWGANAARTVVDKAVAVLGPIALFVATSFEHSVANMFMIPMGIMISRFGGEKFWDSSGAAELGLTQEGVADLSVNSFIFDNLIPVSLGNIVGGAVLVGLFYWRVYIRPHQGAKVN